MRVRDVDRRGMQMQNTERKMQGLGLARSNSNAIAMNVHAHAGVAAGTSLGVGGYKRAVREEPRTYVGADIRVCSR